MEELVEKSAEVLRHERSLQFSKCGYVSLYTIRRLQAQTTIFNAILFIYLITRVSRPLKYLIDRKPRRGNNPRRVTSDGWKISVTHENQTTGAGHYN